jgi:hypothetical protein
MGYPQVAVQRVPNGGRVTDGFNAKSSEGGNNMGLRILHGEM